jgi:hypothetical protein
MAPKKERESLLRELRPHAIWKLIEWGGERLLVVAQAGAVTATAGLVFSWWKLHQQIVVEAAAFAILFFASLAILVWTRPDKSRKHSEATEDELPPGRIYDEIVFGCRAVPPLESGWVVAYDDQTGTVEFGTDPSIHGSLRMDVKPPGRRYAIDYPLPEHATVCNFVQFVAKY